MAGRIPPHFIDELIDRADIAEVIGSRIELKRSGKEFKACCPFHGEKTPSFYVQPAKQFYHCFGCGANGNVVGFLMEHDHLSFVEAIEELAGKMGITVPREDSGMPERPKPSASLYERMELCVALYQTSLTADERAKGYLAARGISPKMIERFGIGYAVEGYDSLDQLIAPNPAIREDLVKTGMLIRGDRGTYPRFRDRIMVPIRDRRGRCIGFGGRILDQGEPKYLNSPETEIFHKSHELFGLHEARQHSRKLNSLVVVEGYMDVIALHQYGITNVVATLGTATTEDHLRILFKQVSSIIFCFDGDRAGRDAAWKALNNTLPLLEDGRDVRFLFLPDGEDPDSFVREVGMLGFMDTLESAASLDRFFIEHLSAEVGTGSIASRARIANNAKPLVEKLPTGVYRTLLESKLAELVGLSTNKPNQRRTPRPAPATPKPLGRVSYLIASLLKHPAQSAQLSALPESIQGANLFNALLAAMQSMDLPDRQSALANFIGSDDFAMLQKIEERGQSHMIDEEEAALKASEEAYRRIMAEFNKQQFPADMLRKSTKDLSEAEREALRKRYQTQ